MSDLTVGIRGVYNAYSNSAERGYSFDIELTDKLTIHGEKFETSEERDTVAKETAEELGVILTDMGS